MQILYPYKHVLQKQPNAFPGIYFLGNCLKHLKKTDFPQHLKKKFPQYPKKFKCPEHLKQKKNIPAPPKKKKMPKSPKKIPKHLQTKNQKTVLDNPLT